MRLVTFAPPAAALSALLALSAFADDSAAPAAAPAAAAKIQLAITPQAGQKFGVQNDSNVSMNVMSMDMAMEMHQTMSMSVEKVAPDGTATMRVKIARVNGKMANPMMGDIEFDSDKPAEKSTAQDQMAQMKSQMTRAFTMTAGKEITMQLARNGKIEKLDAGAMPGAGDLSKAVGGLGVLPDHAVGVGDSWDAVVETQMQSMQMKVKMKNTLTAFDADSATIAQEGSMEMSGTGNADSSDPQAAMMSKMKMTSSSVKGTQKISRKDGLVLSADMTMDAEMGIEGDPNAGDPMAAAGIQMTMKMKNHQQRTAAVEEKKPADVPVAPATDTPAPAPAGK